MDIAWNASHGIVFSCSLGPIPNILSSEIFPARHRNAGMSASVAFQWTANAVVSLAFPIVQGVYGTEKLLWFFATMCGASWAFTLRFVPETKGRTLEEIGAESA